MFTLRILCVMGLFSFLFGGCSKRADSEGKPVTQAMPPSQISYSQLDITESFGDNEKLKPEDPLTGESAVPSGLEVCCGRSRR